MNTQPARPAPPEGARRLVVVCATLALVLAGSSLVLFVLPGYGLYVAGDWAFGRWLGPVHSDHLLPNAMMMQILWAPALPVAAAVQWRWAQRCGPGGMRLIQAWVLFVAILIGWALALATLLHALAANPTNG